MDRFFNVIKASANTIFINYILTWESISNIKETFDVQEIAIKAYEQLIRKCLMHRTGQGNFSYIVVCSTSETGQKLVFILPHAQFLSYFPYGIRLSLCSLSKPIQHTLFTGNQLYYLYAHNKKIWRKNRARKVLKARVYVFKSTYMS
jgi:hypothetical protein